MIEEARPRMRAVQVLDLRTGFCVYGVKVLDFGLAKLTQASGSGLQAPGELSQSPTITSPAAMTGMGVILGTAA
jgi:hypothetical protein